MAWHTIGCDVLYAAGPLGWPYICCGGEGWFCFAGCCVLHAYLQQLTCGFVQAVLYMLVHVISRMANPQILRAKALCLQEG